MNTGLGHLRNTIAGTQWTAMNPMTFPVPASKLSWDELALWPSAVFWTGLNWPPSQNRS